MCSGQRPGGLSQRVPKTLRSREAPADLCGLPGACAVWQTAIPPKLQAARLTCNSLRLQTGRCENELSTRGDPTGAFSRAEAAGTHLASRSPEGFSPLLNGTTLTPQPHPRQTLFHVACFQTQTPQMLNTERH